jgi:hypothetical protein
VDEVHVLIHADKFKDGGGIGAVIFLVADVVDHFEESYAILGDAHAGPQVHCEQLCHHLRCDVLHHQVVDLMDFYIPPFLFILGVIIFPLSFSCFDKVGQVGWIGGEIDGKYFELANNKRWERAVELQVGCNVLRDCLNVEVKGRCHLGSPCVVKK